MERKAPKQDGRGRPVRGKAARLQAKKTEKKRAQRGDRESQGEPTLCLIWFTTSHILVSASHAHALSHALCIGAEEIPNASSGASHLIHSPPRSSPFTSLLFFFTGGFAGTGESSGSSEAGLESASPTPMDVDTTEGELPPPPFARNAVADSVAALHWLTL
jgi:hypothetical protein